MKMGMRKVVRTMFCILLMAVMVFSAVPFTALGANLPFRGVSLEDWFYPPVDFVYEKGLFSGTTDTTFAPNMDMTRGMFVTVLGRMAGVNTEHFSGSSFSDVSTSMYYAPYVKWANSTGVVTGIGNGKFGPDQALTRQDLVTILYRYVAYIGGDRSMGDTSAFFNFDDVTKVSVYAWDAMKWAVSHKIIQGSGNRLSPVSGATRAQVAQIFMNGYDLLQGEGGIVTPPPAEVTVKAGVYTCYTDANGFVYSAAYRPSITLADGKTFSLTMNYGEGMGEGSGTWHSYVDDEGDTLVVLTITSPSNWSDDKTYLFYLGTDGSLIKTDGYLGITPTESVFQYDGVIDTTRTPEEVVTHVNDTTQAKITELTKSGEVSSEVIMQGMYEIGQELMATGEIKNLEATAEGVFFTYADGTPGGWVMEMPSDADVAETVAFGELAGGVDYAGVSAVAKDAAVHQTLLASPDGPGVLSLTANGVNVIGNNKILIAGLYKRSDTAQQSADFINAYADVAAQFKNHSHDFDVTVQTLRFTVADFRTIGEYGAVFLDFPNVTSPDGSPYIILNEDFSVASHKDYMDDRAAGRIGLFSVISPDNPRYSVATEGLIFMSSSFTTQTAYVICTDAFFAYY